MRRRAILGTVAIALWVGGCEVIVGIEEGKLGYCTDPSSGVTNAIADDDNPCTVGKCVGSGTLHEVVEDGAPCARGENAGVCQKGLCELACGLSCKCASDAECPMSHGCVKWACTAQQCAQTIEADGTLIDTAEPYDCKKSVCVSGAPQLVADELDLPLDVEDDCKKPACDGMMPSTVNDDADAPSDSTPGDCQKPVCNGGVVEAIPDDSDEPPDNECVDNACSSGSVIQQPAQVGTACSTGACNAVGQCADCLNSVDWGQCGGMLCPAKMCNGEVCGSMNRYCKSGACVDGVCCNEACTAECKSCNVTGSVGTCSNVPKFNEDIYQVGMVPKECKNTNGFACNGSGACKLTGGAVCAINTDCLSGQCQSMMCTWQPDEPCDSPADCGALTCVNGMCQ